MATSMRPGVNLSRRCAMWLIACAAVLTGLPAHAERVASDRFADVTLKLLSVDANLRTRVKEGPYEVIVLAVTPPKGPCPACDAAKDLQASFDRRRLSTGMPVPLQLKPRLLLTGECSDDPARRGDFLQPTAATAVIVAVDLSPNCMSAVKDLARERKILTITTNKDLVDPLSVAIVSERGQIQIYRSDVALGKEGIRLSPDMIALTRSVSSLSYQDNFREAVRAIDFKNWNEAIRRLHTAIDQRFQEGGDPVLIYGLRNEAYLPHYHLGVALYKRDGKCGAEARSEWEISAKQEAIRRSSYFDSLKKYRGQCPAASASGGLERP